MLLLPCCAVRLRLCALGAFLVTLVTIPPAHAVPDVPLRIYLEHLEPLSLTWPANGTVTDGFGYRWGRQHLGIDVGILRSPTVRAAAAGTVTATGYLDGYGGYGNVVVVDVGEGYEVLYAHLATINVQVGDWLDRDEPLGIAGCTGSCTGTHLHFELRDAGVPVDPAPFVRGG
jgi:murein DD-endopeptidase MepM/ murein hydrolase activator NlpD